MTDRPPRRILHRLGTTLLVAGMATGSLGQRGHQATGDFMLDRSVTIVVSSDEPQPVRLAAEDLAGDFAEVLGTRPNIVTRVEDAAARLLTGIWSLIGKRVGFFRALLPVAAATFVGIIPCSSSAGAVSGRQVG